MKFKKLIALGVAAAMATSVLGACGKTDAESDSLSASNQGSQQSEAKEEPSSEEASEPSESEGEVKEITFPLEETMEFTGLAVMSNTYNLSDNFAWHTALDRANIQIALTEISSSEMGEKGNLLMSSGEYPEVLYKCSALNLDEYGSEGVLIPLEDLIREYAPNLCAVLDERNGWNDITAPDGHIYSLPYIQPSYLVGEWGEACIWINKAWLDNLELDEPRNMEELYQVLKAFKENDANGNGDPDDEIPVACTGSSSLKYWLAYLGDALHYPHIYCAIMDDELVYYPLTEGFKDNYLAYFAKLYEEGLLDKNCFTQSDDQASAIGQSAEVYGVVFAASPSRYVPDTMKYVSLKFDEKTYPLNTGISKGGLAISDKCENPEVIIAWADYFYTEEGGILVRMGVEGKSYILHEDGTYSNINESPEFESRIFQWTLMGNGLMPVLMPDLYYKPSPEEDSDQAHYTGQQFGEEGVFSKGVILPTLIYTEEDNKVLNAEGVDIRAYVENYSAQVISGEVSLEDTWEDFQNTLKEMGAEKLENVYKGAYERAVAAFNK